jgi:hypothetical protein
MQRDSLLTYINTEYRSGDEIVATWFDKDHTAQFLDVQPEPDVLTEAWERIADEIQDDLNHILEFYNFVQDAAKRLAEEIASVEKEWNEDA